MEPQDILLGQSGSRGPSTAAGFLAWAARVALLAVVLAAPWLIGAVEAWVQVWILGVVLVALGLTACHLLWPGGEPVALPIAILPLLMAIGLGAFQLVPFDREVLGWVSPKGESIADEFYPVSGDADQVTAAILGEESSPERRPLSVYPLSTRHDLALLFLATGVFFLGAILFRRSAHYLVLHGLVAVNGLAIAFFGLAQNLTWNGQLYWGITLTQGGGPFGPFINRNNAGGYLVLCLAAAIGLALWSIGRQFDGRHAGGAEEAWRSSGLVEDMKRKVLGMIANLDARMLSWITIAGFLVAAICCTLSRGSVLAMLGAVLVTVTVVIVANRRGVAVLWPMATMCIGLFLIGWVGLSDEVGARLSTLFDDTIIQEARLPHWKDGLEAAGDFLRAGSGLGTYRFTYAPYQEHLAEVWFHYAENVYLQVLVEGGIIGLVLFLGGLGLVAASIWRLLTQGDRLTTLAMATTGVFAMAGQMVASLFDFGLLIPANFLLFALLCGSFVGSATRFRRPRSRPRSWMPTMSRTLAVLLVGGLFAGCFWGQTEIRTLVATEKAMRDVRLAGDLKTLSEPDLTHHIDQLGMASRSRPDDAELHRRLAELWMQRYQVEAMRELLTTTSHEADDSRLSQLASTLFLHQRAWLYTRSKIPIGLDALRQSPSVKRNLLPALEHLIASRQACPMLPEIHCGIAQLCGLVGPISEDQIHIERTRRFAPGNPDLLYICGLLDFHALRFDSAQSHWKASLTLSRRYLRPVLEIAGAGLAQPGVVEHLLPDAPELLVGLARGQFAGEESQPIREQLLARAEEVLPESDLPEAEKFFLRGSIAVMREAYSEAIEYYTRAVDFRTGNVMWRYELALLLQQQGRLDEAHDQARRCARFDPDRHRFKRLLEEIHDARLTQPDTTTSN